MSYRYLSRESMVSLTTPLVDENHADCQAIKSDPLGRALWEVVAGAHARLLSTQRLHPSLARLGHIRDELARLRERHGQVVRGIYHMLQAQEELAGDAVLAAEIRKLRARIFPDNLMATRRSNRALAGQALLLRSRLAAEDLAVLAELGTLGGGNLNNAMNEWFAIAAAMGELENERSGGEDTPTGADVAAARAHWIRTVQAFIATLRLRDDLPAAIASILDRIERVVRSAGPRRARTPADQDTASADHAEDATSATDTMSDAASADDAHDPASADDASDMASADDASDAERAGEVAAQQPAAWLSLPGPATSLSSA